MTTTSVDLTNTTVFALPPIRRNRFGRSFCTSIGGNCANMDAAGPIESTNSDTPIARTIDPLYMRPSLWHAQRDQRIDAGYATSWYECRQHGHDEKHR